MQGLAQVHGHLHAKHVIFFDTGERGLHVFLFQKLLQHFFYPQVHGHLHAKHVYHIALKTRVIMAHKYVGKSNKK